MLHDLSRTIGMMGRLFLALARDRPAELALGAAIGGAGLLVFGVLAGFLRRYAIATTQPPVPDAVPGEEDATPVPGALGLLRDSAGRLLLVTATSFVLLGFGVFAAMKLHTSVVRPAVPHWYTVAYFAIVAFLGIGLLLVALDVLRTWALWLRFAGAAHVRTQAEIRHLGERTWEAGEGFETALTLRYAYRAFTPGGREIVFVAEERVTGREGRRLRGAAAIPVAYDRDRPARVRRE